MQREQLTTDKIQYNEVVPLSTFHFPLSACASRGFGLVEAIVASAILSISLLSVANFFQSAKQVSRNIETGTQVDYLLEEGIESLKLFRDMGYTNNILKAPTSTPRYFAWNNGLSTWATSTIDDLIDDTFERKFAFADVYRDGNSDIASSGTYDPNVRLATVSVSWLSGAQGAGRLTALSPSYVALGTAVATYGTGPITSPDSKYVYAIHNGEGKIYWFSRNMSTGALAPAGSINSGVLPMDLTISPDGSFVYVANKGNINVTSGTVTRYSRNAVTGALSNSTSYTISSTSSPTGIAISPDGLYVYVVQGWDRRIVKYTRNLSTGALTGLVTVSTNVGGYCPAGIVVSPDGTSLYATGACSGTLTAFTRNMSTGNLTEIGAQPIIGSMSYNYSFTFSPDATFFYIPNSLNSISMYSRDTTSGALTLLTPSMANLGSFIQELAISPEGFFVYALSQWKVFQFSRNVTTGLLSPLNPDFVTLETGSLSGLVITSDGSSLYTADGWYPRLYQFSREPGLTIRTMQTYITNIFSN